jgi:hypothetical protein
MTPKEVFDLITELSCQSFEKGKQGFITYLELWQAIRGTGQPFVLHVIMNDLGLAQQHAAHIGAPAITSIVLRQDMTLTDDAKKNIRNYWQQVGQSVDPDLDRFIVDQQKSSLAFTKKLCRTKSRP